VEQLFVVLVEVLLGRLFVAEYLDDLLAVDHLLDIAVECADGLLLTNEEVAALSADEFGDEHHHGNGCQHKQRQPEAGVQHGAEHCDHRDNGGEDLRDTLRQHLPQGVGVVGVKTHDVATGVGVEIADGQRLHVGEHLVPNGFEDALRHNDHQAVI